MEDSAARDEVAHRRASDRHRRRHRTGVDVLEAGYAGDVADPAAGLCDLLDRLGFTRQHVRLQVYGHHLASSAEVVEWTRGSSLTRFARVLNPEEFERFVDEYRRRLVAELGDRSPYFYTFKRTLLWGRLA